MEKHKAIIYGNKIRVMYDASRYSDEIETYHKPIEKVEIFSGDIDNPPLLEKERIFIPELKKVATIESKARNLDGGYVYYTNYTSEIIEDEETEKSKKEAEEKLDRWKAERQTMIESKKVEEEQQGKWYRKFFKTKK